VEFVVLMAIDASVGGETCGVELLPPQPHKLTIKTQRLAR